MMRRLASRGARFAAFLFDLLLVSLLPSAIFYPAYAYLVPKAPPTPILPLDLLTEEELRTFTEGTAAYQRGLFGVGGLCLLLLWLGAALYHGLSVAKGGQTLGMRASNIRAARSDGRALSRGGSVWRGLLHGLAGCLLVAALVLAGNLSLLLLDVEHLREDQAAPLLRLFLGALSVLVGAVASLFPARSPVDLLSGSALFALSGDFIEDLPAPAPKA